MRGEGKVGKFRNPVEGWSEVKVGDKKYLWTTRAVFRVTLNRQPLCFQHPDGYLIRPKLQFPSDHGTVPVLAQPWIPKDRFLLSFLVHDSACLPKEQGGHGLYFATIKDLSAVPDLHSPEWAWCEIDSPAAHRLLKEMVRAQGGSTRSQTIIHWSVSVAGPHWEVGE